MDHIAILNPKMAKVEDIIKGDKTIESRWYKHRVAPYGKIQIGETVYFKKSGGQVMAKARVKNVIELDHSSKEDISKYIDMYKGKGYINLSMSKEGILEYAKGRPYIILIFLEHPSIIKPFSINKTGFGISAAWICIPNIDDIAYKEL